MKLSKFLMLFLSLALLTGTAFAQPSARSSKFEALQKERAQYMKDVNAIVDKYNAASDSDKPAIKAQLTEIVSKQTDADIVTRKKLLDEQKERITKLEAQIAKMEKDKTAYVNEKVDFILSPKGQKKAGELRYKVVVVTSMTNNRTQR